MTGSNFVLRLELPQRIEWREGEHLRTLDRENFMGFLWDLFGNPADPTKALQGIHEGTMLSDEAFEQGFETESFTLDSGEAPRERDWIGSQDLERADLYFPTREAAEQARARILEATPSVLVQDLLEQPLQDWDAEWKASFQGVSVPPNWEVRPPWVEATQLPSGSRLLRLNPGAGFGTGTHETTQLCLELVAGLPFAGREFSFLDFGSGSGILAIGAALLGGRGEGVEIDELAIENAIENARLNGIEDRIEFRKALSSKPQALDLVFANILKPVLLEFAPELVSRMKKGGALILSGLIEKDLEEIIPRYQPLVGRAPEKVIGKNEWRAVLWRTQ